MEAPLPNPPVERFWVETGSYVRMTFHRYRWWERYHLRLAPVVPRIARSGNRARPASLGARPE
jgi:hypothetical protein